jgi:hypothetical protein
MYTSVYVYFVSGNTVSTLVGQHPGGLTLALALGGADPDPNPSPLIPNASNPHQVNIKIKTENHVVWSKDGVDDTGAYTFYVPPDMKAGLYTIEVVGMEPEVECVDSSTFQDAWGFPCAAWSGGACESLRVTSCNSHPPVVIVTNATAAVAAAPAVAAVVASNGTILTPAVAAVNASAAVPAVTTGGNPWAAYVPSYPMGGGLGSAGFAMTQAGKSPSPDIYGVQCTVDDLSAANHYWGSGGVRSGGVTTGVTKGNDNAAAIRAACPVACNTCPSNFATPYVGSCQSSTCQTTFTMGANPPPPSSTPPPVQWEVPIIQAFKGSFGLDEIKHGPGPYGTTISSTSTVSGGGTHPGNPKGGLNCDYVCHVYEQSNGVVGGRRLLFGGLQSFDSVDTNVFVGCSQDMRDCGCCPGPAPVPYVPP